MLRRLSVSAALIALSAGFCQVAVAATAYELLQSGETMFQEVLRQDAGDQQTDAMAEKLDGEAEFFPVMDGEAELVRPEDPALAAFVSFRIGGVPYVLKDVPSKAWFAPYVRDMAEQGIVSGYKDADGIPTGVFAPERSVSIEELAKMAIEAARIDRTSCPAVLKNAAATLSWSANYISCAEDKGFALYADGTVDIARPATRSEVVMTIVQAFGVPLRELADTSVSFKDVTASTLFSAAIATAAQDGIVAGYPDHTFGPDRFINRAEVSKVLSVAIQVYGKR